jgi:GDP-L-fucose synthase
VTLTPESKIFLAGHTGLLGTTLQRRLRSSGYESIVTRGHRELDLTRQQDVENFFAEEKPRIVILAAAKVGGIAANMKYPAQFIYENLAIQMNIIHSSYVCGVEKLIFFGSACSYPRECPQPMREEYLLTGPVEPTNEPYAVAKIAGIKMCQAYNRQYGVNFICAIPTNAYGPNDNFDPKDSHVIPALLRRFHEAGKRNEKTVQIWGSGSPVREFLYVEDFADAVLFLMERYNGSDPVNVGSGQEISVRELAFLVKDVTGYAGDVVFDSSRPDGSPRKALDTSRMKQLGWEAKTLLGEGLRKTYQWYQENPDGR